MVYQQRTFTVKKSKETILGVSIKLEDSKSHDVKLYQGLFPDTHLTLLGTISQKETTGKVSTMGFYSKNRNFITRQEAFLVAEKSDQLLDRTNMNKCLYVKDLKMPEDVEQKIIEEESVV